ncbi:MAG: 30S ribosomal protein S20 [Bradymonadales bacterium]|nr:MAG: 30S ribosomal protein S20 [Bradymonadales bacterium]
MANHRSAEKRARQNLVRSERNRKLRAKLRTAVKSALLSKEESEKKLKLSEAFSKIQKARGVLHPNTVKRKMARLAKAVNRKGSQAAPASR